MIRYSCLAIMLSVLSACGFHLAKPMTTDQQGQWQNAQFIGSSKLADEVLARLQTQYLLVDRVANVKTASVTRPLLELRKVRQGRRALGLSNNGLANGYELSLSVEVVMSKPGQGAESRHMVAHRSLQVDVQNPLLSENQIDALKEDMRQEMVDRVLRVINLQH